MMKILCELENLLNDTDVQICWVPSPTGINRNDQADKAARSTLNVTKKKGLKYHIQTLKRRKINTYNIKDDKNNNKHNKLLEIKLTLGEWKQGYKKKKKKPQKRRLYFQCFLFVFCLFVLWHINLFGQLMPNKVFKSGKTEKYTILESISRETFCRKILVSLKIYL